jgi:RNA polymerase sigma-70 factor, ECF subfamily
MNEAGKKIDLVTVENDPVTTDLPDESLVANARSGDERAFEEIFSRYRRRMTSLVGRFFRRPERVEEIVQEVFTKLYLTLDYYRKEPGKPFISWLSSIAINSCYDELRRARRRPESSISEITPPERDWLNDRWQNEKLEQTPESNVIARDLANKLLSRLSPEDRLLLTLLDGEELTVNEIAQLTGWSVSKVKVRAHRARAALRKVLSEYL